jgi:hypothetical protein
MTKIPQTKNKITNIAQKEKAFILYNLMSNMSHFPTTDPLL